MAIRIVYKAPLDEIKTLVFWQDVLCELFLAFLLITMILISLLYPGTSSSLYPLQAAVMAAFMVTALIEGFEHISMSLSHPPLTLVLVLTGRLSLVKGFAYSLVQCVGASLSGIFVPVLGTTEMLEAVPPLQLAPGITQWQAFGIECLISLLLLIVSLGVTDSKLRTSTFFFSLPIAFTIAVGIISAGNLTGPSINPIIAIGRSIMVGSWQNHWVYWAAPYTAAILSVLIYESFTFRRAGHKYSYNIRATAELAAETKSSIVEADNATTSEYGSEPQLSPCQMTLKNDHA